MLQNEDRWFLSICYYQPYFGEMGYEIHSEAESGKITMILEPPTRNAPEAINVRFRHPQGKPMKEVVVNGKNGNDGSVHGNAKWVDGKSGKAMEFDGATYVEIPDKADSGFDGVPGLTIEVWVKQDTHHDNGIVVKLTTAGQFWPCSYNLETWSDQLAYFGVGADTGQWAAGGYPLNEWFHLAGVFDNGEERLYINGKLIGAIPDPSNTVPDGDLPVYVGTVDASSYPFKGVLDELAIYSRALSEAEIQQDMNTGIVTPVESIDKLATTWATIRGQR